MDKQYAQVKAFHEAFGHPIAATPTAMSQGRVLKRAEWMKEELDEFVTAEHEADPLVSQADAMIDLIYFALGTLVEMGVPPERMFELVQQANMAKLWPDGKPRFRGDGKIIKPVGWQGPEQGIFDYINQLRSANT